MSVRSWFASRGIRAQILVSIAISLALALAIGLLGLQALGRTNASAQEMANHNVKAVEMTAGLGDAVYRTRIAVFNHAFATTAADQTK